MDAGDAAVPCLIKKVTDTTRIPDPAETLKFPETTVGDIAYFLLIDITKLGFVELMPREVQEDYKNNGVWAYYAYVAKKEHRKNLQNKLYEWYRQKYGNDARALTFTTHKTSTTTPLTVCKPLRKTVAQVARRPTDMTALAAGGSFNHNV